MKTTKILTTFLFLLIFGVVSAQNCAVIKIKTSAVCDNCKDRIEKALSGTTGVQSSDLDLKTKIITVKYIAGQTNPDKIRQVISNTGYDADNLKANTTSYKKLPSCCQKS